MTGRRHLLVVASQCERMAPLTLLGSAATELHDVLADSALGACLPGLRDGRSLCVGMLDAEQVCREIREAVEYAAAEGASLVLVLLGHGFVPGSTNDLHMMVGGSRDGDTLSAISVPKIFGDAVDRLGLAGVIGIVDTCSAAGAIPDLGRLLQGNVRGQTRVALLMAAAVQRSAVEFRLARGVTRLLRAGVLGDVRFLDVHTVHDELTRAEDAFPLVMFHYDGSLLRSSLWLGHNRRHGGAGVGSSARTMLVQALAELAPPRAAPTRWSSPALKELRDELAGAAESPETAWTLRVVDSLVVAMRTTDLLHALLPGELDTPRLRRAMAAAGVSPTGAASTVTGVAEIVEQVAVWHPVTDGTCRAQVARFVMALLSATGKPFDLPEITAWGRAIQATVQVNDAITWARQLRETKRLRLIVSLHASNTGDWPEVLETWLLLDGKLDGDGRSRIPCTADKAGVEEAIVTAVDQAEERADQLGLPLDRIEVAVPSKLLLEWQPEKIERGEWIGADFTVVLRWSERLNPAKELRRLTRSAMRRLDDINDHVGGAPVVWLDHLDAHDLLSLREKLIRGNYRGAVALDRRPPQAERLFSLLLAHVPILLWPQPTCEHPFSDHGCLDLCWDRMPDALILAYRREWQDDVAEPVARLRAVWDDKDWLEFCKSYQRGIGG